MLALVSPEESLEGSTGMPGCVGAWCSLIALILKKREAECVDGRLKMCMLYGFEFVWLEVVVAVHEHEAHSKRACGQGRKSKGRWSGVQGGSAQGHGTCGRDFLQMSESLLSGCSLQQHLPQSAAFFGRVPPGFCNRSYCSWQRWAGAHG